jgi:nucleoside diphosphate kinase
MDFKIINYYIKKVRQHTVGFILFKPNCPKCEIEDFRIFCKQEKLKIVREKQLVLDRNMVIALYSSTFNLLKGDLKFGVMWKYELMKYLTRGQVNCFLVDGNKALEVLSAYKYFLRKKYNKVTNPKKKMSKVVFKNKVIKNIVHVADEVEIQSILWLIFS